MCVAAIAWNDHPDWLLVAIANRDEFHERPAAPLAFWADGSGIIAGRDLQAGGTWLGVTEAGRFALLTNFRDPAGYRTGRISRGGLVTDYLTGKTSSQTAEMNAFNLFVADSQGAQFVSNYPAPRTEPLAPGIQGLSNGAPEEPWPKTLQLCGKLDDWLKSAEADFSPLFAALRSETPKPGDPSLRHAPAPDYAPVFIRGPLYGTRCSTVTAIDRNGQGTIIERSFDAHGRDTGERRVDFRWPQRT